MIEYSKNFTIVNLCTMEISCYLFIVATIYRPCHTWRKYGI